MICVICGKEFAPRNCVQKTCSKACSRELGRRRSLKRHYDGNSIRHQKPVVCVVPKNTLAIRRLNGESLCMWCGKEFATKNPLQKFCCDEHGQQFYGQLFNRRGGY